MIDSVETRALYFMPSTVVPSKLVAMICRLISLCSAAVLSMVSAVAVSASDAQPFVFASGKPHVDAFVEYPVCEVDSPGSLRVRLNYRVGRHAVKLDQVETDVFGVLVNVSSWGLENSCVTRGGRYSVDVESRFEDKILLRAMFQAQGRLLRGRLTLLSVSREAKPVRAPTELEKFVYLISVGRYPNKSLIAGKLEEMSSKVLPSEKSWYAYLRGRYGTREQLEVASRSGSRAALASFFDRVKIYDSLYEILRRAYAGFDVADLVRNFVAEKGGLYSRGLQKRIGRIFVYRGELSAFGISIAEDL
ncbi:MAG: hypothetical protein AAGJ70_03610 [Pseudomonadota bacterium]